MSDVGTYNDTSLPNHYHQRSSKSAHYNGDDSEEKYQGEELHRVTVNPIGLVWNSKRPNVTLVFTNGSKQVTLIKNKDVKYLGIIIVNLTETKKSRH